MKLALRDAASVPAKPKAKPFGRSLDKMGIDTSAAGRARRTYDGRVYMSGSEMRYAAELDLKKRTGVIVNWAPQYRVVLEVNGKKICTMFIDFKVWHKDGSTELVEVKGFETEVYKVKRKLFEALNQDVKYTVVKAK